MHSTLDVANPSSPEASMILLLQRRTIRFTTAEATQDDGLTRLKPVVPSERTWSGTSTVLEKSADYRVRTMCLNETIVSMFFSTPLLLQSPCN